MPLIPSKSKKAFSKNVETEMNHGKPQPQALAVAYATKRKNSGKKKYAAGGSVSASDEKRPMPESTYDDSKTVSKNSGNKASKKDSWTDNSTVAQAQSNNGRMVKPIKGPKMVGSDAFSVRNRDMHDDEADLGDRIHPETDRAQPVERDNEYGPNRQGTKVSDMAAQHNNKKAPYIKEIEDQYAADVAAANMKKVQSYAEGGPVMEPKDNHDELEERTDEGDMQQDLAPGEHGEQPASWRDEEDADGHGNDVPALHMKRMANGGEATQRRSTLDSQEPIREHTYTSDEEALDHAASIVSAVMAKRKMMAEGGAAVELDSGKRIPPDPDAGAHDGILSKMLGMARGGPIKSHDSIYSDDSDQADLSRNADEDANEEDQTSFNALRKENYSESAGLSQLDAPMDSNEDGRTIDHDKHDMLDEIRNKMKRRLK